MTEQIEITKERYTIADVNVVMTTYYQKTKNQASAYRSEKPWTEEEADCVIDLGSEYYQKRAEASFLPLDSIEYLYTGSVFNRYLLKFDGCMLHSSAVAVDGYAYLFSADSGTGKSTHTQLWLKHFGEQAYIINDDKPAIRFVDGAWYVYGTPWSGKTNQNKNTRAKLGAIVFLERSSDNYIREIHAAEAVPMFMKQTVRKFRAVEKMDMALGIMERILLENPIFKLGCNISDEAVVTAYQKIRRI